MSRIRTNFITNRMANGAPTVSNGLVISGVTTCNSTANQTLLVNNTASNGQSSIAFQSAGATKFIVGSNKEGDSNRDFFIYDVPTNTHRFNIDASGKVGINTDSPSQMLTVRGTILKTRTDSGLGLIYLSNDVDNNGNILINQNGGVTRIKLNSNGDTYFNGGSVGINTTTLHDNFSIAGNLRFINPNNTVSRVSALPTGAYSLGVSGGSAIAFHRTAEGGSGGGSDEIAFETHWQGNRHGESMRINKYGHVTIPNQPSFHVTIGGGQINSNVGTIVFTDTTSHINHNIGNHYSTSTGRFTAPIAGRYLITARMLTNSSTTSYTIYLIRRNGTSLGYIGHNHSDYWLMESGTYVMNLNANDYIDCYLQQHSGHGGYGYASFSGYLIA